MNRHSLLSRAAAVVVGLVVTFPAAGCGKSYADLTGRVTYRGRPVVYGVVSVVASDHMTYYGTIQTDGTYSVRHIPVGPVRLGVYSPDPYFELPFPPAVKAKIEEARKASPMNDLPKPPKGQWFRIPAKYADPTLSPLAGEVTSPASVVDCNLE